jgi:hypothetical protein
MPLFTIETTYRLPVYRHRTYEADSLEAACRLAVDDEGWGDAEEDVDSSGETYVTGAWDGRDCAYSGPALAEPSHFDETVQRKADHFEILLGLVKVLRGAADGKHSAYWIGRAGSAIAKAEAILAGSRDPASDVSMPRPHILVSFDESEVRSTIGEIIAGDETLAMFSADSIGDDDIHTACVAAVAAADFAEERGSVLFKAAIAAIRSVWRAPDWGERRREMEREE